jgi:signal transduction histidine kinase/DNA-binding response OmpR family regulator
MAEPDSDRELVRRVFLQPGGLEDEEAFRERLTTLTQTGLQWGGLVGVVGVLALVLVHWGLLGRPATWWYPASMSPDVFVLWDKAVVVGVCLAAVGLGARRCRLWVGRAGGTALALAVAVVSLTHDAYRGILSVEYLVLVYLLVVAVIPYRPWQALVVGLALTGVFYGLGHYGLPGTAAAHPALVTAGHLVRMGFASVVLTGVSGLLYVTRIRQHRARRTAERLHEQVADLERAKSRFFADVSDEFRTPLTLLLGSIREALDGRLGELSAPLRTRFEIMDDQAQRMRRRVGQLLELTAIDEGRLSLSMREVEVVGVTRRLVPPFREWADAVGLDFQLDEADAPLQVWLDVDRYRDVLTALLSNAIAYTPEGGSVRLRIRSTVESVVVSVRDTGPGLPEGLRARVFGDDARAMPVGEGGTDDATADRWIGMGIGLAHARALVRRHQGTVEVDSEPGFGTEVTVRLPRGDDHVAPEDVATAADDTGDTATALPDVQRPAPSRPAPPEAAGDAPTVVVVDDEAEMRDYLRALLAPTYRVVARSTADEALAYLREEGADLVVSDAVLPGRDGRGLCRAIRDDEQLRSLPVILLTTRPDDGRLSGVQAGADAALVKPFDPVELEARVETLIEIRRVVGAQAREPEWMPSQTPLEAPEDPDFVQAVITVVDDHIGNSNFGVDWLADEMDLSARHLRRRLKEETRLSPAGLIRARRLQHAARLLEAGADTVADVASAVGYRDASHFSRLFKETVGCSPSEYVEGNAEPPDWADIES